MSAAHPLNEEFILAERPALSVTETTFKKQTVPYPDVNQLKEGQVIAKLLFASVDPYMRGAIRSTTVGAAHYGLAVAEVVSSLSARWQVGDIFFDGLPWRRYSVVDIDNSKSAIRVDAAFLKANNLSPAVYLSALGMVSRTAYFGVRDVLQIHPKYLKAGHELTVVVSGAAGATGGLAIQYARLFGATKVIAIAGGKDKCDYVVKELGADAAIDYKEFSSAAAIRKRLEELAPQGVDRYFDNTGGAATDAIFDVIKKFARIAVCGQISLYNTDSSSVLVPAFLQKLIYKSATVQGFVVNDFVAHNEEFFQDATKFLAQGKIKDKQHLVNGFDQIPKAFIDMFAGANTGKVIIDCSK